MNRADLHVRSGTVIALRVFDIAYSVDIRVIELLRGRSGKDSPDVESSSDAGGGPPAFERTHAHLRLDPIILNIDGTPINCTVSARLYDFGVVSLSIEVPATEMNWAAFVAFSNAVDRLVGPASMGDIWPPILEKLRGDISPALVRPNSTPLYEAHLLAIVREWSETVIGTDLPGMIDLPAFFSTGGRRLSEKSREDLIKCHCSHYEDDLIVINRLKTFVYDSTNTPGARDIIEAANVQLLEFRYYNQLLDEELPRMYGLVRETRRTLNLISSRRFANLARKLYTLVAEVTELKEKAETALRITDEPHLVRIYRAALENLRVPSLSAALDRKLAIIRDTYTALYQEASGARGELLELAIVLLIILEIAITVIRHAG